MYHALLISIVLGEVYLPSGDHAVKPNAAYSTCQCGGSNKGVCHCLQNGLPCHCSPSKGSIWNLNDKGQAVSKTGSYENPKATKTPTQSVPAQQVVQQAVNKGPQYTKVCTPRGCYLIKNW